MSEWMRTTEVAQLAGINKQRVYMAVDKAGLPAYRIGRHYRFKRAEVEEWVARRTMTGNCSD